MADEDKNKIFLDAFKLPPADAIEYLESKGLKVTFDWHDMMQKAHTKAFTAAGVIRMDILKDLHDSLVKSEKEGFSYSQFKADIVPTLIQKGWYGKQTITRPDGSTKEVDLSAPWRLKLIFNINMRTSLMAGRYKSMMEVAEARPYWRYIAIMDSRVREEHARLHGKIFHYKDPFWRSYYPPNGWNCRCRVDSISKAEFNRKGYKVESGEDSENQIAIDPEWNYNPADKEWKLDYGSYPQEMADKLKKTLEKKPDTTRKPDLSQEPDMPQKPDAPQKPDVSQKPVEIINKQPLAPQEKEELTTSVQGGLDKAFPDFKDADDKPLAPKVQITEFKDKNKDALMLADKDKIVINQEAAAEIRDLDQAFKKLEQKQDLTKGQEFMLQALTHETVHLKAQASEKGFSSQKTSGILHELGTYHLGLQKYPEVMQKFQVAARYRDEIRDELPIASTLKNFLAGLKKAGLSEAEFAQIFEAGLRFGIDDAYEEIRKAVANKGKMSESEFESWMRQVAEDFRTEARYGMIL